MLKRDHQVVLPTQARAPGFRVELRGTTFRLVATGAWTVAEATQLDTALKRLRVPTCRPGLHRRDGYRRYRRDRHRRRDALAADGGRLGASGLRTRFMPGPPKASAS